MEMSKRIKERRKAMGLTQEELANKLGLQNSAIAKYEKGRVKNIKRSVIAEMSKILDCSPSYLMGFDEERNKNVTIFKEKDTVSGIECDIIRNVKQMNSKGKKMVYDYTNVVIGNPNYSVQEDEQILSAAHKRTDINPTKEDMDHDQKLMEDKDIWGD